MTTLVIEDGSIVSGANSYISLADAKTYWSQWGISFPLGTTDAQLTNALFYAAYSLEKLYGRFYAGHVMPYSPQNLLWPRQGRDEYRVHAVIQDQPLPNQPQGIGAKFVCRVVGGIIQDVYIINGGSYYNSPTMLFQGKGQGATATLTMTGGVITGVTLTNGGAGYFTPRSIEATDGRLIFNDVIPQALKDAQCEIAVFAVQNLDALFPEENDARIVKSETQKIGQLLDQTQEYFGQQKVDLERYVGYRKIDLILWPIIYRRVVAV